MKFDYIENKIVIHDKVISKLDKFVLDFMNILSKYTKYVIVSGYVPIFFGRTRGTEDIDVIIEHIDKNTFVSLYDALRAKNYYFMNPENVNGLYEMLEQGLRIRAAKVDTIIPNVEIKFLKDDFDSYSLKERVEVSINDKKSLFLSKIELEIPYKLYLGSEKDIEDATYLWDIFKDKIDINLLKSFMKKLNVTGKQYGINV